MAVAIYAEIWPDQKMEQQAPPEITTGSLAHNDSFRLAPGSTATGPGREEKNAPSPEEECPDAEVVQEHLAIGELETDLFEIGTDRFVVSYEILQLQEDRAVPTLHATVEDEDGRGVASGKIPSPRPGDPVRIDLRPNMGRTIVDAEPGSYRLDVTPSKPDRRYAVLVEECGVPSSGEA